MINIIIPYYNSEKTIKKTLDSLVSQTQNRFLVTIVDDCSNKNPIDIIESYKNKLNINYIRLIKNVGPGWARQIGLFNNKMCEYIMFLDADDMLMPNAIEVLNREASKNKPDILVSQFLQQNKYSIDVLIPPESSTTWLHGKVYKYDFLINNNISFSKKIKYNEDAAFNTLAYAIAENIYEIPITTVLWVDNKDSITRKDKDFLIKSIPDYIIGQTQALEILLKRGLFNTKKEKFAGVISYIYNYYELFKYSLNNQKYSNEKNKVPIIDANLYSLFKNHILKKAFLNDKDFIKLVISKIRKSKNTENYTYLEQDTFISFCNYFDLKIGEIE